MNGLSQPLCLGLASLSIGKEQVIIVIYAQTVSTNL